MASLAPLTSRLLSLWLVGMAASCSIPKCCTDYDAFIDQQTFVPTCTQLQNWCVYNSPECVQDDDLVVNVDLETNKGMSSTSPDKQLTNGESAIIAVAVILVIAIIAAVGVSVWKKGDVSERSDAIELTENLVGEVAESPRQSDPNGMLTVMTITSCIFAVVALIVAVVAISDKSHSTAQGSSSSGNSLESIQSSQLSSIQLRTGPAKLSVTGMLSSHPWCHQTTIHWASCAQLQESMNSLIDAIGSQQADVNETMRMVSEGRAGDRTFVIANNAFVAASPELKRISAKLNQPHQLANTTVCTDFTPTSKQVCISMHTSLAINRSVLVAYLNPNTQATSTRTRRHHGGFLGHVWNDLSKHWHGSKSGAIHGAESGAWQGAVTGAIAGIAGGPAGVIGGALSGAATGAITGAISGGIEGGEHYVGSKDIHDAVSTSNNAPSADDYADNYGDGYEGAGGYNDGGGYNGDNAAPPLDPTPPPSPPPSPPVLQPEQTSTGCSHMTSITADQLTCIYPQLSSSSASNYASSLTSVMGGILGNKCAWATFLGNVGTESAGLTEWTQIPCDSSDDAPYCGRGPLQITGIDNYKYCAGVGVCGCSGIVSVPSLASSSPAVGFGTAACVWDSLSGHNLSGDSDGTLEGLRKTACYINAGHYPCSVLNGWESRQHYWSKANTCLGV